MSAASRARLAPTGGPAQFPQQFLAAARGSLITGHVANPPARIDTARGC
ncbi:hypothetical protein [Tsukamurella soli]